MTTSAGATPTHAPVVQRVAVLGAGVAAAATAVALLQVARTRARPMQVKLFQGDLRKRRSLAPAILGPECRSRLAGLGVRVPVERRVQEIRSVEVVSAGHVRTLPAPASGLWVMDGWSNGESGQALVTSAIAAAAEVAGAEVSALQGVQVERHPPDLLRGTPGELVVRAGGRAERFHAAALATGAGEAWGDRFFRGFQGAPGLPAAEARLRFRTLRPLGGPVIRLILTPAEGVDGLYLIPAGSTVYALAYGPGAGTSALCQALMEAARDGQLGDGFELSEVRPTTIPSGAGSRLTARGQLAVGTAALGHPLQLGLSETLAGCTRAAAALVERAQDAAALERSYVREGMAELLRDANHGARASIWLTRARERGARAVAKAAAGARATVNPFSSGVLGLAAPSAGTLLSCARWAGLISAAARAFRSAVDPLPPARLVCEPDLYYVVDDDDQAREALAQFLEAQGAQVVSFSSELALYSAVARRPPTAILLDVVLHWVDGLRLCQGLKRHPLTRRTRVFVMSGLDLPHVREGALAAGAEAFFVKPLQPQLLLQLLAAHRALSLDDAAAADEPTSDRGAARGEVG